MAGEGEIDPKVFVLKRELSEVYLLLDYLSLNPDNRLPLAKNDLPSDLDANWLDQVCKIDWPPGPSHDKAAEASLLIRTKDFLNTLAKPASGATIAFTVLVTQDTPKKKPPLPLKQRLAALWDTVPPPESPPEERDPAPPPPKKGQNADSRGSLACKAYPDLARKARHFRQWMWWMFAGLVVGLLLTSLLSWYVAYGNAAIAQQTLADTAYAKAVQAVETTEAPTKQEEEPQSQGTGGKPSAASPIFRTARDLCTKARGDLDAAGGAAKRAASTASPTAGYVSVNQMQACEAFDQISIDHDMARQSLETWQHSLDRFSPLRLLHPIVLWRSIWSGRPVATTLEGDQLALASARVLVLGNGVLPFCFGLLGAGAAVTRSLSRKTKTSTLSPRDLNLSYQQLALGAVTGACIGLFVAQPGGGAASGAMLGSNGLSSSALSFIAGFGVDAVFTTLEGIIQRIFNLPPPPGSTAPADRTGGSNRTKPPAATTTSPDPAPVPPHPANPINPGG